MKFVEYPYRVVKIGGSLLELPDLVSRIDSWNLAQPFAPTIWIVGGGKQVNEIRRQQQERPIDPADAHWKCIELMDSNSRKVANWFPEWAIATELLISMETGQPPNNLLLQTGGWLRENDALPESWDVTSDSIAAHVASTIGAAELVLLKSGESPPTESIPELCANGYVDLYFADAVAAFSQPTPIRMVNFKSDDFTQTSFVISNG